MHVVYAKQDPPKIWSHAIFLAGPTPRDPETPSWRPEALKILETLGYNGVVFVPEQADGRWQGSYTDQTEWEEMGLEMADKIVFWVPRNLVSMPALTTNVEFGRYVQSGKAVLGFPEGAPKMRYLEWLGSQNDVPVLDSLEATLKEAIWGFDAFPKGPVNLETRRDGERYIPKVIFETPMFQAWYDQVKATGNRLDEAKVLWTFRMPKKRTVFSYVLWVKVWITTEGRWKENEWVFARTDVACVVLYKTPEGSLTEMQDTELVLVKEFRSPARTPDGFIHELPGGSVEPGDSEGAITSALREVHEETGLAIAKDRVRYLGSRQAVGTLSSHHIHCFGAELEASELAQAKTLMANGDTFGETDDTELTYVEVVKVGDLLKRPDADWTTLGLVFRALMNPFE